jgi:membrane protein DedA with SNARE-associated domain/rhodanese-related sulfurtransferase
MELMAVLAQHGYAVVAVILFLAAAGLPLPTSVVLLAAGALAHDPRSGVTFPILYVLACIGALSGDILLFFGGRYTGWWLLAGMCRLSMNPEGCIFSSSAYFYRRGAKTLLFAKWIPGLSAMAAPLAGSLNMRYWRFLRLDVVGVALYCLAWLSIGYTFSRFLDRIEAWLQTLGHAVVVVIVALIAAYAISVLVFWIKARKYNKIPRIAAEDLRDRIAAHDASRLMIIADVRSHNYYDPGMQRIKNSIRVEPSRLKEELVALREFMQPECEIYLYCSCAREATSVRVARMLEQENCSTKVIQGGLKAWIKAGGPLEPVPAGDVEHLPQFD